MATARDFEFDRIEAFVKKHGATVLALQFPAHLLGAARAHRGDLALATAIAAEQTLRDRQILLLSLEQSLAEQVIALELASQLPIERWN